ncbi:MAG: YerC/YecD family TrpR-related protein [Candidatus Gracilibacteria bacterium]
MAENWKNSQTTDLFKGVLKLRTAGECEKFFRDLCTLKELEAMAERWQVVKMVDKEIPYREVSEKTGASTATITRVAHWLHHGEGGYRMVLNRL